VLVFGRLIGRDVADSFEAAIQLVHRSETGGRIENILEEFLVGHVER